MADLIDDVRISLRQSGTEFDSEIQTWIGAAKAKLRAAGVDISAMQGEALSLANSCVIMYVKANFGRVPPEEARTLLETFDSLAGTLALAKKSLEETK